MKNWSWMCPLYFNLGSNPYDQTAKRNADLKSAHFQLEPEPPQTARGAHSQNVGARAWDGFRWRACINPYIALLQVPVFRFDHLSRTPSVAAFLWPSLQIDGHALCPR